MKFLPSALAVFFLLATASAEIHAGEISLVEINGPLTNSTYQLRWKDDHSLCQASQDRSGASNWKAVPFTACEKVLKFLSDHRPDLNQEAKAQKDPDSALPVLRTPKARIGRLSFSGQQWYVNLNTAKTCDVTFTHCKEPNLSSSAKLALELRTAITAELGRLK